MRCDAGAVWEGGRPRYACPNEAVFQVVMPGGMELLAVYCEEHKEHADPVVRAGGRLEPIC